MSVLWSLLVLGTLALVGGQAALPAMPATFSTAIEANFLYRNYTLRMQEYYDGVLNRCAGTGVGVWVCGGGGGVYGNARRPVPRPPAT